MLLSVASFVNFWKNGNHDEYKKWWIIIWIILDDAYL